MIPKSLRGRVAFAAASATAVVIILGGFFVSLLVDRSERITLDRRLNEQAVAVEEPVEAALRTGGPVDVTQFYAQRPDVGTIVRVYENGQLLLSAGSPTVHLPYPSAEGFTDVEAGKRSWRMITETANEQVADGGTAELTLQVAVPVDATEQAMKAIRQQIFAVGIVSAALAAMAGWFFGEVAMRPLTRLRLAAEGVAKSNDLSVRVPADTGPTEVDDVANSLNTMLSRIQEANESTKAALASSRAFAGNAAHEMRTPLTSMQANLDVLSANPDLPPEQLAKIVVALSGEQHRLVQLIDALHTLARGDVANREQMERIDIADLVGVAIDAARRNNPAADIRFELPDVEADLDVMGWNDGLRVMVDNLIANAVKHGGSTVAVSVSRESDSVCFTIEDNGSGVAEEDRERIFERFERGRDVRTGGTGLGLALVAQQAKLHDGRVGVTDSPSLGGARFEVVLPASTPQHEASEEPKDS